ncbi:MAG: HAD family hydrolase [Candidatus Baldrarchaeia archaeon]
MIKAVLFDFIGTLAHLKHPKKAEETAFKSAHKSLIKNGVKITYQEFKTAYFKLRSETLKILLDEELKEVNLCDRFSMTLKLLGYDLLPEDKIIVETADAFFSEYFKALKLDENTIPVLKELKEKYILGIVSLLMYSPPLQKFLDKHNMLDFFDVIVTSADVGYRKPHPKIFLAALEKINVKPLEAVFIGDDPIRDVLGAKNVGMKTILIQHKEKDYKIKPDKIIVSLLQLPEIIGKL